MQKHKKAGLIILASSLGVLIIAAGGYTIGTRKHALSAQQVADRAVDARATAAQNTTAASPTAVTDSSTLQASNSQATAGLGQMPTNAQATSGTASSSSNQPFDPTTFAQYEKYKNDQSSLSADVQAGTGAALTSGQKAKVYYRGWLTNGTLFDQSRADSSGQLQPFSFTVGAHQVIAGWDQGLIGMKPGGVRLLIVPPATGYGATAQSSIPANSVLVFQVQLISAE